MKKYILYHDISQLLTLEGVTHKRGRKLEEKDLSIIPDASLVVEASSKNVVWFGPNRTMPPNYKLDAEIRSLHGYVVMPSLVECHTHAAFAGSRVKDFSMRVQGKDYLEIAKEGGGILSTVQATRTATLESLTGKVMLESEKFYHQGVGALEIKSGYGLSLESEIKILKAIDKARSKSKPKLVSTFMAAHGIAPEFNKDADKYMETILKDWLPLVMTQKLSDFCDIFVEKNYFQLKHAEALANACKGYGLGFKIHCEQFMNHETAEWACQVGAQSCEHLDHVSDKGVDALAESKTVAVLLPGASLFTGTPLPPARKLLDRGACVALSTDFNPGTSPTHNLALMATLGCTQMKMKPWESIAAITYNAACALKLESQFGHITLNQPLKAISFKATRYEELLYYYGELGLSHL